MPDIGAMTTVNARDLACKTADVLDEVEKTGHTRDADGLCAELDAVE